MASKKGWKNTVVLAGIDDCGRSRKWGCRGRFVQGFKPRHRSHVRDNHVVLGLPCSLGNRRDNEGLGTGTMGDLAGKERGERTLTGETCEGAT